MEVASCYIHFNHHYLFLLKAKGGSQELTWGLPAGKLEKGEKPRQAVIREIKEETGITLTDSHLTKVTTLYIRYPHIDFIYHMFTQQFTQQPPVHLSSEHQDYCWKTIPEALNLPLISAGKESLQQLLALNQYPPLPKKGFYFIRHGETNVNADPNIKRVDYDLPLNIRGKQQAAIARDITSKLPIKNIRFSPIQRAKETKDILASTVKANYIEDSRLGECKANTWTEMVKLEDNNDHTVCSSVQEFLLRVLQGVHAAFKEDGPTLIVAHGSIHWAICYHMMVENHPWKIGNCKIVHFEPTEENQWKATIIS